MHHQHFHFFWQLEEILTKFHVHVSCSIAINGFHTTKKYKISNKNNKMCLIVTIASYVKSALPCRYPICQTTIRYVRKTTHTCIQTQTTCKFAFQERIKFEIALVNIFNDLQIYYILYRFFSKSIVYKENCGQVIFFLFSFIFLQIFIVFFLLPFRPPLPCPWTTYIKTRKTQNIHFHKCSSELRLIKAFEVS